MKDNNDEKNFLDFSISKTDLIGIVGKYQSRTFDEDILELDSASGFIFF